MKSKNTTKTRKAYQIPTIVYEAKVVARSGPSPLPTAAPLTNDDLFK